MRNAILTEKLVISIRQLYAEGLSQGKLAKRFRVSSSAIQSIVEYKSWKHVPPGPPEPRERSRFVSEAGL